MMLRMYISSVIEASIESLALRFYRVKFAAFLGDRFGQTILQDVLERTYPHGSVDINNQARVLTRDTLFEA